MSPAVVSLKCPSCGSPLQVPNRISSFACAYCGSPVEVRREGGIITLEPVIERLDSIDSGIRAVQTQVAHLRPGVDSTASELAIQRLDKELLALQQRLDAVRSKGMGCATALFLFGILGLCGTVGGGEVGSGGVALVIAVAGGLWLYSEEKRVKSEREPLLEAIARAQQERARHMSTVRHGS